MSGKIVGLVFRKRIGGAAIKAVLAYCAERADEKGCGVWVAKTTMAAAVEMDRATVYRAVTSLVNAGLLRAVGKRRHPNGETIEYDLDLVKLAALPDATSLIEAPAPRRAPPAVAESDVAPVAPCDALPVAPCDPSHHATPPVAPCDPKASHHATQTSLEPPLNRKNPPMPPTGGKGGAPSAREKAEAEVRAVLCEVMPADLADDFMAHRRAKRAKVTLLAAQRIAKSLRGHPDPAGVVNHSIANGYTGLFPESVGQPRASPPDQSESLKAIFAKVSRDLLQ